MPSTCSSLDILQELIAIHENLRSVGKIRSGRLIAFLQAKGGIGTTTIAAATAKAMLTAPGNVLLWDMDIESRDLTRSMNANGVQSKAVSAWVDGTQVLSRDTFFAGLCPVTERLDLLPPPDSIACMLDYVAHMDCLTLMDRLIDLARLNYDSIIVDCAGRMSPITGEIIRLADQAVIVVDDTLLGLSAAQWYLKCFENLLSHSGKLKILCCGTKLTPGEFRQVFSEHALVRANPEIFDLPIIPFDPAAQSWSGTGATLFESGRAGTRRAFVELARKLGVMAPELTVVNEIEPSITRKRGFGSMLSRFAGVSANGA